MLTEWLLWSDNGLRLGQLCSQSYWRPRSLGAAPLCCTQTQAASWWASPHHLNLAQTWRQGSQPGQSWASLLSPHRQAWGLGRGAGVSQHRAVGWAQALEPERPGSRLPSLTSVSLACMSLVLLTYERGIVLYRCSLALPVCRRLYPPAHSLPPPANTIRPTLSCRSPPPHTTSSISGEGSSFMLAAQAKNCRVSRLTADGRRGSG